jgi:outer membrane protein TolC
VKSPPVRGAVTALLGLALAGCASLEPAPLPQSADLASSLSAALPAGGAPRIRAVDPAQPLDQDTLVALAVLNNPDLKAERLKAGVAGAQVFEAGLLPDPQLSLGLSRSTERGGYDVGIAQEVQAILTRGARKAAAEAQARQVNLEILWQEWQVAEKARELYVRVAAASQLRDLIAADRRVLARRVERDRLAMLQNAATVATVNADGAALADADAQLRELELQTNDADHALHALVGLEPRVPLRLGAVDVAPLPTAAEFEAAVAALPKRRPDLLALQAGYLAQQESVRAAVLGRFPAVSIGIDRARSAEEGVATIGASVSVSLPIFNRNRGRVAVGRATRDQARGEYQARLDQAVSNADRLWRKTQLLDAQRRELEAEAASAKETAEAADREFRAGRLSLDQYAALVSGLHARDIAAIRARVAQSQAQAAFAL